MRAKTLIPLVAIPLLALAGCAENSGWNPNYQAGASNYGNYLRAREMALTGRVEAPPQVVPVAMPSRAPTAAAIAGTTVTTRAAATPTQPRRTQMRAAPAVDPLPEGAVIVTGAAARTTPAPQPVRRTTPPRSTAAQPAAVTATVLPGSVKPLYARTIRVGGDCTAYATPRAAQAEFTARGGPERDPLGLDPDGDGNACGYRPGM